MGLGLGSGFGRYRIDGILGRGGMGTVFRAQDLELGRPVALKVLSPELAADSGFRARFVREARLLASLDHASVVPIYEAGEVGGLLFLAMRYVPGRDLGAILRREGPLDPARVVRLLGEIAQALDAAHSLGLVHRDVKASNILVSSDKHGQERVFLADFGLTKRRGSGVGPTRPGQLVGSVGALAPEQIEGHPIDGRADQYALACLMYECLTGDPPFDADNDLAVLVRQLRSLPPDLREARPDLPSELAVVIARGLARRPDGRYASCGALIEAAAIALGMPGVSTVARAGSTGPGAPAPGPRGGSGGQGVARAPGERQAQPGPTSTGWVRRAAIVAITGMTVAAVGITLSVLGSGDRAAPIGLTTPLPPGRIVFVGGLGRAAELYSIRVDGTDLARITDDGWNDASPAISPDGMSLAYASEAQGNRDIGILRFDDPGATRLTLSVEDDDHPAWSWDGQALAFTRGHAGSDIFVVANAFAADSLTSRSLRITTGPATDSGATWSPDGPTIAMSSDRAGRSHIWRLEPGADVWHAVTDGPYTDTAPAWSPDGSRIAFVRTSDEGAGLFRIRPDGRDLARLTRDAARQPDPAWSPDGRFLVYARGDGGDGSDLVLLDVASGASTILDTGVADVSDPYWGRATWEGL